jgi:hypothetical protein
VPQPISDRVESDPLLEFSSEPGAPSAAQTGALQPAAGIEVAPVAQDAAESIDSLQERIGKLERRLAGAASEVITLRSQVATLVSATRDINKRVSVYPAIPARPAIKRRSPYRVAFAAAGLVVGMALAAWLWIYATSADPIVMRSAPAPEPAVADASPSGEPVTSPAQQTPKAVPVAAPVLAKAAQVALPQEPRPAVKRIDYVGTLSIDASPDGEVFINRQDVGRTPLRLENLKAGSHLIWIERDGYRRWTKVVEVPADRVSRVFADLEPMASR